MINNFIFYDTETSDRDPFFGQIFQLAAIHTDENFATIDEFDIRSKRLPHILPSPGALLVNGLDPHQLDQAHFTNYEFAGQIRKKLIDWSPAIVSGYNIFGFDEKYLRSLFYQNLYPPYISQTNGNSRIDILPLVQAAEHLYPGAIVYLLNAKGRTSKKLEDIAPANGFENHNAHDALGDVEATIFVAELIKTKAPILWKAALDAKNRHKARMRANRTPVFFIHDRNYGHPITFPAAIIGSIHNGRDLLVADLRFDLPAQSEISIDKLFNGPTRLCRTIKLAEAPLLFSSEEFYSMPHTYKWDEASINEKIELWSSLKEKIKITELYSERLIPFEKAEYPEAAIYEDFDAFNRDAETMHSFHEANPTEKLELVNCFSDPRFKTFARRIIYDNHYEVLGEEDCSKFSNAILHRLNEDSEVPWITTSKALEEADKLLEERPERQPELEKIKAFLVSYKQG
jgi:exodeoxyribonuclease-1